MGPRRLARVAVVLAVAAVAIGIVAIVNSTGPAPGPGVSTGGSAGSRSTSVSSTATPREPRSFYVSSTGDDRADGSAAHPWRTVAMVNSVPVVPGDRVLFAGGDTFTDSALQPQGSGSATAPIVFGSYGSGRARITRGVYFFSRQYLTFEDLALGPHDGFQGGSGEDRPADQIVIRRCAISLSADNASVGIYSMGDDWTIADSTISEIGNSGMLLNGSRYTITGNTIHDIGLNPGITYNKHGIYLLASDARISGNRITRVQSSGISARLRNSTITDNQISDGDFGISFFEYDPQAGTSRWTGNVITGTTVAGIYVNGGRGTRLPTHESFVIRDNTIRPAGGVTINLERTSGHASVTDNGG